MYKVILSILLILPTISFASQTPTLKEFLVAGSIKNLAKVFIHACNLSNLKIKHIKSLTKLDDAKFRKRYDSAYKIIKDVPLELRLKYGLREDLTKQEAIQLVERVTKEDLLYIVNAVPNDMIVKNIRSHSKDIPNQNMDSQINATWGRIMQRV